MLQCHAKHFTSLFSQAGAASTTARKVRTSSSGARGGRPRRVHQTTIHGLTYNPIASKKAPARPKKPTILPSSTGMDAERSLVSCAVCLGIPLEGDNCKRRYDVVGPKFTRRPGDFRHMVGRVETNLVFHAASTTPLARRVLSVIAAHVAEGNRVNDNSATDGHTN